MERWDEEDEGIRDTEHSTQESTEEETNCKVEENDSKLLALTKQTGVRWWRVWYRKAVEQDKNDDDEVEENEDVE